MADGAALVDLLGLPALQRALLAGLITGALGGALGSFAVLRQLSFFADALGHAALLGITLGIVLGTDPVLVLLPVALAFAVGVHQLTRRSRLPADALLNILTSSSLAVAVLVLSRLKSYRGGLEQLLFGDILSVSWLDLGLILVLSLVVLAYLRHSATGQILLSLDEGLARSRGVAADRQRLLLLLVLSLVVALSIKAVGVLLISAFLVIPACASRLISRRFDHYVLLASLLGAGTAVAGLLASAAWDLPSGPSVVVSQLLTFLLALSLAARQRSRSAA
ncbi:MAG: metal ABC transporter permease [Synechococcus sp. ELA057]